MTDDVQPAFQARLEELHAPLVTDPEPAIEEYTTEILTLQRDLLRLQQRIHATSPGVFGIRGRSNLSDQASDFVEIGDRIRGVQSAAVTPQKLPGLSETDQGPPDRVEDQHSKIQQTIRPELDRIATLQQQTSAMLTTNQDTANTRLGLLISVIAILISTASILVSILVP